LRNVIAVSLATAAVGALAGCGGDKPAYCQDRQDLKASIDQLKQVDVRDDGLSAVRADIKNVQGAASTLAGSAKKEFASETDALTGAVSTLGSAVKTAAADPSKASLATVVAGISGVQAAFGDLSDAVDSKC
jgi:hypothetical protein